MNPVPKKTVSHPKDIAEAFSTYYETLYDSEESENKTEKIKTVLENIKLPKLTESDAKAMRDPITKKEIEETIKSFKNNKVPGIDGYPSEFYKCFQGEITQLLQRVFNYALTKNDPPKSWSKAIDNQ